MAIGPDTQPDGKRERRKAERRAAIVEIATRHFLERGYAGTSLSAIAEAMGGSKGTLWSYFSSKEALFAAVVDAAADAFRGSVTPMLSDGGDVPRVLTQFVEAFIERITSPTAIAMQRLIIGEAGRASEAGAIFFDRAPARTHALMIGFIDRQMAAGCLRPGDPAEASALLFRLCAGGLQQQILWGVASANRDAIEREAAFVVRHFLAAYSPPLPPS